MLVIVVHLLLFATNIYGANLDDWINEIYVQKRSVAAIFENSPLGQRYNRGFPRGLWGTNLAPDLGAFDESRGHFVVDGFFWNKAKQLLSENVAKYDPQASYNAFRTFTLAYMCNDNQWTCCKTGIRDVSCKMPPKPMQDVFNLLVEPKETMAVVFMMWWCIHSWAEHKQLTNSIGKETLAKSLREYCPSACKATPCRRRVGVDAQNMCKAVGPFDDDFECICRNGMIWDGDHKACKSMNPCFRTDFTTCFEGGTLTCVAVDMSKAVCICNSEYMGADCSQPRNACLHRFNRFDKIGNANCGVEQGNQCNPILGTDYYRCTCAASWANSPYLVEENCAQVIDPCGIGDFEEDYELESVSNTSRKMKPQLLTGVQCLNGGNCISSGDFTQSVCVCPITAWGTQTHTGLNCEQEIGTWSSWSVMTDCRPEDCGVSQYRWRHRQCLSNFFDIEKSDDMSKIPVPVCFGISEELQPCSKTSACRILRLPGQTRLEAFNYNSLFVFIIVIISEILLTYFLWQWVGSLLITPCFRQRVDFPYEIDQERKPLGQRLYLSLYNSIGKVSSRFPSSTIPDEPREASISGFFNQRLLSTVSPFVHNFRSSLSSVTNRIVNSMYPYTNRIQRSMHPYTERLRSTVGSYATQVQSIISTIGDRIPSTTSERMEQINGQLSQSIRSIRGAVRLLSTRIQHIWNGITARKVENIPVDSD